MNRQPCTKEAIVHTIVTEGRRLEVPTQTTDGSELLSGHGLRTTGAQGLARLGLDLWANQLLGRWGSERVEGNVLEARSATWVGEAARRTGRENVVADIVSSMREGQP